MSLRPALIAFAVALAGQSAPVAAAAPAGPAAPAEGCAAGSVCVLPLPPARTGCDRAAGRALPARFDPATASGAVRPLPRGAAPAPEAEPPAAAFAPPPRPADLTLAHALRAAAPSAPPDGEGAGRAALAPPRRPAR